LNIESTLSGLPTSIFVKSLVSEMTAAIVLGSVVLIFGLALYQPIWIRIKWGGQEKLLHVRYLILNFRRPKERKKSKPKKKEKDRQSWINILDWIKLAPELIKEIGKGLRILFRYSEIRHLRIDGALGTDEVDMTGFLWGITQAFFGTLKLWIPKLEMNIYPNFTKEKTALNLDAQISTRMGGLLTSTAVILWHIPKRKLWRVIRKQRKKK
jgi:hypothetical protein